jgi:hypothetical protein
MVNGETDEKKVAANAGDGKAQGGRVKAPFRPWALRFALYAVLQAAFKQSKKTKK